MVKSIFVTIAPCFLKIAKDEAKEAIQQHLFDLCYFPLRVELQFTVAAEQVFRGSGRSARS
jgi:hypothetical protein